ncbi:hypothetical protein F4775DRAFT_497153 [Biscogniauxia sp. FL1348]|nr:hypothetical protein F4775DRAFT_497153 [Biscogniauxia sp. FL1348]
MLLLPFNYCLCVPSLTWFITPRPCEPSRTGLCFGISVVSPSTFTTNNTRRWVSFHISHSPSHLQQLLFVYKL